MRLQKCFFVLVIFLASLQLGFGQEKPKAELIDEFGDITCEELIARQDNLMSSLNNDPTAVGYAVIYGNKNDYKKVWRAKFYIGGHIEFRNFNEERLIIIRGKEAEDLRIQFWKVPAGAEKPAFEELNWNFTLSANRKPFIFLSTGWEGGPCDIGLQLKTYANYLVANPSIRGNVVVFAKSKSEFQDEKEKISGKLTNNYKIPSNQLRFFHQKIKDEYSYTELWLVPQKKK